MDRILTLPEPKSVHREGKAGQGRDSGDIWDMVSWDEFYWTERIICRHPNHPQGKESEGFALLVLLPSTPNRFLPLLIGMDLVAGAYSKILHCNPQSGCPHAVCVTILKRQFFA